MQKGKRVGIVMPHKLADEIDKQAKLLNLSRSSYITMVCSQHLEQRNVMATLESLVKEFGKESNEM